MGGSVSISPLGPDSVDRDGTDSVTRTGCVTCTLNGDTAFDYVFDTDLVHADTGELRMLLISDNIQLFEVLIQSVSESVLVVPMRFECQTVEQLKDAVRLRAGEPQHSYASIGIIDHGCKDELCFLRHPENSFKKLKSIQGDPEAEEFFMFLAGFLRKPCHYCPPDCPEFRIDLLTCHAEKEVLAVLRYLTRLVGFNVVASLNDEDTACDADDGAERHAEILSMPLDADEWYFYEECFELWRDSVLASAPVCMKEMCKRKHAAMKRSALAVVSRKVDRRNSQLESIRRQRAVLKGCFRHDMHL